MRSLLLAAALATSVLVTDVPTADACGGGYFQLEPAAHAVVTPAVRSDRTTSYALLSQRLDEAAAAKVTLERLDPMSFDNASTAANRKLSTARTLTLLGPSGTKLFDARSTVWLDLAFDLDAAREAIALPKGRFVVALEGKYKDATWTSLATIQGSTVTSFSAGDIQITLPHGSSSFEVGSARLNGYPLGIAVVSGVRYLAVAVGDHRTDVSLVRI